MVEQMISISIRTETRRTYKYTGKGGEIPLLDVGTRTRAMLLVASAIDGDPGDGGEPSPLWGSAVSPRDK